MNEFRKFDLLLYYLEYDGFVNSDLKNMESEHYQESTPITILGPKDRILFGKSGNRVERINNF